MNNMVREGVLSEIPGHTLVGVVSNDGGVVACASGIDSTVGDLALNIANDGTLRHASNRKDVSNIQGGFFFNVCISIIHSKNPNNHHAQQKKKMYVAL